MSDPDDKPLTIADVDAAVRDALLGVLRVIGGLTSETAQMEINDLEAYVRGRAGWLHGWYEGTRRSKEN